MQYKFSRYNRSGELSNGNMLVFNSFSSAVVELTKDEFSCLCSGQIADYNLPESLTTLLELGILVPSTENELAKLLALRNSNNYADNRAGFQILPTTECNARCFYCYEKDFKTSTMTKETADATIEFILDYCTNMDEVTVTWFGGEPFVCENMIDYISSRLIPELERQGKKYYANVITNGALISKDNITKIIEQYRIRSTQITLDGHGSEHIRRKSYLDKSITYEGILETIALLTQYKVEVLVRINIDKTNFKECLKIVDDLKMINADTDYLWPYFAPLYTTNSEDLFFKQDDLDEVYWEIFKKLIDCDFIQSVNGLPMNFSNACCCAKMLNNFVISPNGTISKCEHLLDCTEENIGNVFSGIQFNDAFTHWTASDIPEACKSCVDLPICQAGCYAAEQQGFGYGRCSYVHFIPNAVIAAVDYLKDKRGDK